MRVLNFLVIGALIAAAAAVYKIKFDSTLQAEQVAKLRDAIREQRDAIASLRAEWARLATPSRIQSLAERHLHLEPVKPTQFGDFSDLPERPSPITPPTANDPIGAMLADPEVTGGIPPSLTRQER